MGKTLGVLSGVGHLPVDVVRGAKKAGYRTVAIALVPGTHEDLEKEADVFHAINIGKVGKIFKTLKQEGVDEGRFLGISLGMYIAFVIDVFLWIIHGINI